MRTPVTILSGFLGSGKTTRLNALLRAPHGRRLAVVLNELGAIGVDASRLSGAEEFVELEGGCVCCALNVEFSRTLERLAARGGIDHVVVETTGIADPLSAAWTIDRPGLRESFRLDAIVTVVDALNLDAALATHPEATLQIERADLVLLSKLDATPGAGPALVERVRALNPAARIVPSAPGDVPWELLLDALRPGTTASAAAAPGALHDTHHTWQAWELRTATTLSEVAVEDFLRALPQAVYRAKGLVRTDGDSPWLRVHAVAGRYEIEPTEVQPAPATSVLLCIGRDLDRDALDAASARLVAAGGDQPPASGASR